MDKQDQRVAQARTKYQDVMKSTASDGVKFAYGRKITHHLALADKPNKLESVLSEEVE